MAEANLGSKRTVPATATRESMETKKRKSLVASLPKKMAEQMSHFRFSGSPKRKFRLPKRGEPAEAVGPVPGPRARTPVPLGPRPTEPQSPNDTPLPTSTPLGSRPTEPQSPENIVKKLQAQFPSILSAVHKSNSTMWITFFGNITTVTPNGLPSCNPKVHIEISDDSVCRLEVHCLVKDLFPLLGNESRVASLIATLLPTSEYVLCPGLPSTLTNEVNFESKSLRKWVPLFSRADNKDCALWYARGKPGASSESRMCYKCDRLSTHLRDMLKKKKSVSPATKLKRQSAGSNYSKKYLTPEERVLRARNEYLQKKVDKRVLKKCNPRS